MSERSVAKDAGDVHYFTGKPCKRGHVAQRFTSGGNCTVCLAGFGKQWKTEHREEINARERAHRAANPRHVGQPLINMVGQRFGHLVVESLHSVPKGGARWNCLCDCGTRRDIKGVSLRSGLTQSCGCRRSYVLSLLGQRFGKLVVAEKLSARDGKSRWKCVCDCGVVTDVAGSWLSTGNTGSCGCRIRDAAALRREEQRRKAATPEMRLSRAMRLRGWYAKQRAEMANGYLKALLAGDGLLSVATVPHELVEMKREQLRLHRSLKVMQQAITERENPNGS